MSTKRSVILYGISTVCLVVACVVYTIATVTTDWMDNSSSASSELIAVQLGLFRACTNSRVSTSSFCSDIDADCSIDFGGSTYNADDCPSLNAARAGVVVACALTAVSALMSLFYICRKPGKVGKVVAIVLTGVAVIGGTISAAEFASFSEKARQYGGFAFGSSYNLAVAGIIVSGVACVTLIFGLLFASNETVPVGQPGIGYVIMPSDAQFNGSAQPAYVYNGNYSVPQHAYPPHQLYGPQYPVNPSGQQFYPVFAPPQQ